MTDDWLNKRQNERLEYKENMMSNECVCEELSKRSLFFFFYIFYIVIIMIFLDKYFHMYIICNAMYQYRHLRPKTSIFILTANTHPHGPTTTCSV